MRARRLFRRLLGDRVTSVLRLVSGVLLLLLSLAIVLCSTSCAGQLVLTSEPVGESSVGLRDRELSSSRLKILDDAQLLLDWSVAQSVLKSAEQQMMPSVAPRPVLRRVYEK